MAKENVAKFFEKLATDKALAEKLAAADKAYGEKHEGESADEAARKAAAEAIILPVAKEAGFDFNIDELIACEQEKAEELSGEVSDDEMTGAAGGIAWGLHVNVCISPLGIGAGASLGSGKDNYMAGCFVVGTGGQTDGYAGSNAGICVVAGIHT